MSGEPGSNGEFSKAEEFRNLARQTVTLKCGLKIQIRKLTGLDWLPLGNLPLVEVKGETAVEAVKRSLRVNPEAHLRQIKMIICQGVISPHIVDAPAGDCPEGALSVYEIPDQEEISTAILSFSGLTEAAARAAGPFPEIEVAPSSRGDGGKIPSPAE